MSSVSWIACVIALAMVCSACAAGDDTAADSSNDPTPLSLPAANEEDEPTPTTNAPRATTVPTPAPSPAPVDDSPLTEIAFIQSGGTLNCADGEARAGMMFWAAEGRFPLSNEAGSAEELKALGDSYEPGGFFGYSHASHFGTYRVSPIADYPIRSAAAGLDTSSDLPFPVTLEYGNQDCSFEANAYTTYSAYQGSFECSAIDADSSFILKERGRGNKLFLAWRPSNADEYILSLINDEGKGTFKARGINDGSIDEVVTVDFSFSGEIVDRRMRVSMTGELLYQDDSDPRTCSGEWTAWTEPEDEPETPQTLDNIPRNEAPGSALRYEHTSATRVWASGLTVIDGGDSYEMPTGMVAIERGDAVDRKHITVEMQWQAADGTDVNVHFYTRHDGQQWWTYEIRTWVDREDRDDRWIYYPGDNDTFFWSRESGVYFRSPLGTAYQGRVELDTLIVEDLRFEAFGAEFPVDQGADVGDRQARFPVLEQDTQYRFETNFGLIDVESIDFIIEGEKIKPEGEVVVSNSRSFIGDKDRQEMEIRWLAEDGTVNYELMFYFRSDGSQWWINRLRATRNEERIDLEQLALAATPLGEVFVGDIIADNVELRDVSLRLIGCSQDPGLNILPDCPFDP